MRDQNASADGKCPITLLELFRKFWEMDRYPVLGNEGTFLVSTRLEKEAFANISNVVIEVGDPPEFIAWLEVLKIHPLSIEQYDNFVSMLYDYFEPEEGHASWV